MLCSIAEEEEGRHGPKRWRIVGEEVKDRQKSCTSLIAPITMMPSSSHPATPCKAGIDNLLSPRVVTPEAVTSCASLDAIVASPSEDAGGFFQDTEGESDQEEVEVSLSSLSTKVFLPPLESSHDSIHGQESPCTTKDRPSSRWSLSSMDASLIPTTTRTKPQRSSMEMKWWLEHQRGKRLEFELTRLLEECQTKQATLRLLTDELYAIRQERHKGIVAGSGSGLQHTNKSLIVSKIGESPNKCGTKGSKGLDKTINVKKERRHRRTSSSSSSSLHSTSDSSGGSQHTMIQVSMIVVSLYIMNGGRPILVLVLSCAWMWAQMHVDDDAFWILGT